MIHSIAFVRTALLALAAIIVLSILSHSSDRHLRADLCEGDEACQWAYDQKLEYSYH